MSLDYSEDVASVTSVHFGVLSPDRIRQMSVCEIYRHIGSQTTEGTFNKVHFCFTAWNPTKKDQNTTYELEKSQAGLFCLKANSVLSLNGQAHAKEGENTYSKLHL